MAIKLSKPYSLYKKVLEKNHVYQIYNAKDNKTGQIWLAKIIDNNFILQNQLADHLGYNEQVLLNLQDKKNVTYVHQIFTKEGKTYFIQEKYDTRLSTYLEAQGQLKEMQVEQIIKNLFEAICDIYEQGYVHRSIRPEHIIKVQNQWKIQMLVFDNKEFNIQTPYTWSKKYASPEQKIKKYQLDTEQQDAQLVWQFSQLALVLLYGKSFLAKIITKDSDLNLQEIKKFTKDAPKLFEMIEKSHKINLKDRIILKQFFKLPIFSEVLRDNVIQYFMTASKIYKVNHLVGKSSINKGIAKSQIFKSLSYSPIKLSNQNKKDTQERILFKLQKCRFFNHFFSIIDCLTISQEDKLLTQYQCSKLNYFYLEELTKQIMQKGMDQFRNSLDGKKILKSLSQIEDSVKYRLKGKFQKVKKIKSSQAKLLQNKKIFLSDITQENSKQIIAHHLRIIFGSCYSQTRKECEQIPNEKKEKLISFLIYFIYLALMDDKTVSTDLTGKIPQSIGKFNFTDFFQNSPQKDLTKYTQQILMKYFKVDA